jgi:hypothetical protein
MDSDRKPRRKYTVSTKVLAANRENLKKALAARKPAPPPRQAAFNSPFIWDHVRQWGRKALATLKRHQQRLGQMLPPQDERHKKLAEAVAQGVARWISLLRDRARQERSGMLCLLKARPRSARSAFRFATRLVGLFEDEEWMEKALDQLGLRLQRLGRIFWENRNISNKVLTGALDEVTAEELGNPFQPIASMGMESILLKPAEEKNVITLAGQIVLPELPAEKRWESTATGSAGQPPTGRGAGVSPASQTQDAPAPQGPEQQQNQNGPALSYSQERDSLSDSSPSPEGGWTAAGAFISRRWPGEGLRRTRRSGQGEEVSTLHPTILARGFRGFPPDGQAVPGGQRRSCPPGRTHCPIIVEAAPGGRIRVPARDERSHPDTGALQAGPQRHGRGRDGLERTGRQGVAGEPGYSQKTGGGADRRLGPAS